jgi:DHA1 family multidrug resistance protein-like MFS transporter
MSFTSFFALGAAVFAAAFGYAAVMPLLPELLTPLVPGAGPIGISWHAGAFAGIYMLSVVVFSPVWGAASDRYGTKPILLLGLAGSALAVFALAFAESLWTAYFGRAVQGAFASALLPVATSALAPIPDTAERARKVAGLGAASLLGFFAAPALTAGLVSGALAQPVAAVLYASAAVALAALLIVMFALTAASGRRRELRQEFARPLPARFLGLNLLAYLGLGAFEVALPLAARGPLAVDPASVSLLFVECSLMMLMVQGALMWAAPYRAHFSKVLIASIAAYGAGLLWLAGTTSFSAAVSAVGLIAAGSGLALPLIGFLATLEIEARPGAALGRLTAAGGLGQAVGSLSGGALYGYAGMGMFTAVAFAVALGAWLASPSCAPRWLGGNSRCTRT